MLKSKNITAIICLSLFILITFPYMITHIPHCDEVQGYMSAYYINKANMIDVLRTHGHPILWYLILLPFAKTHFAYPYPMLIINYLFTLGALLLLWFKSPFNNIFKTIVTFSFMMVSYFAIVARCYSIGVLGLFILASLYKEQTKKPILYSIILSLTAHTSAMASIGVIAFSCIFVLNLIKDKKNISKIKIFTSLFILLVMGWLCIKPFLIYKPYFLASINSFKMFFYPWEHNLTFLTAYILSVIFLLYTGIKAKSPEGKQSVFFLIFSVTTQILLMIFIYPCFQHHNYFFLIYLILTAWIQNIYKPYKDNLCSYFYILMAIMLFSPLDLSYKHGNAINQEFGKTLQKDSSKYNNSVIMFVDNPEFLLFEIGPYLVNNPTITIINGNKEYSYTMYEYVPDYDEIQKIANSFENKNVYIFANEYTDLPQYELQETYKNKIKIYKVK